MSESAAATTNSNANDSSNIVSPQSNFGMMGIAVMGENLALNIADHGFHVAAWNREPEVTKAFIEKHQQDTLGGLTGTETLQEFVSALERSTLR